MAAVVFTNSGHSAVVTRIIGSGVQPSIMAWGTGVVGQTDAVAADNTVSGEINNRVTGTAQSYQTTLVGDTYELLAVMSATAAYGINNAAVFDNGAAGNSLVKGNFLVVNLASGDSISFTVRLQLT